MKLIIQIPCLNEQDQLPTALRALPRQVAGFDEVEWLIIDDGSTDATIAVARAHGVDHVIRFSQNRGLSAAFQAGLDAALKLGADVIVNTDADNQYDASAIPLLVEPILAGEADMVIGDRDVSTVEEFSALKKRLQIAGSWIVRKASGTGVTDATSGFRAYSRHAALGVTVVSPYTYTIESIIQAGRSRTAVANVAVGTNPKMRDSRLFGSTWGYIRRNAGTITRVFAAYEPMRFFGAIAAALGVASFIAFMPFTLDWVLNGNRNGHVQSIIVASILAVAALQVFLVAILADMMRNQRVVSQKVLERVRGLELQAGLAPSQYVTPPDTTDPRHAPTATLAEALPDLDSDAAHGRDPRISPPATRPVADVARR